MKSTERGRKAEAAACEYLQANGYKILSQNWRTRYCEIDIVATKQEAVFFVEVKYRSSARQGTGIEYITPKKLEQMQFAAEWWVLHHGWQGEYCLSAISLSGEEYSVDDFVKELC